VVQKSLDIIDNLLIFECSVIYATLCMLYLILLNRDLSDTIYQCQLLPGNIDCQLRVKL